MKKILLTVFVLLLIPVVFGEIIVLYPENNMETNVNHEFNVNKYFFQQQTPVIPVELKTILIEPLLTEYTIEKCQNATFSFKLTNPSKQTYLYNFKVMDFQGIAFITPNLLIPAKEARIVNYMLAPDCDLDGEFNPKIKVETKFEEATIPNLLHINPGNLIVINQTECRYYFNDTACASNYYIRFYQSSSYKIDLSQYFHDPDDDWLEYSANEPLNVNVKIRNSVATLKPRWDFYGSEEIVFFAKDNKGGQAESKKFFIHVLPNNRSHLENFIFGNLAFIVAGLIAVLIFFILLILLLRPNNNIEED